VEASFVARCACLGLLLEVSAYPKPGNVDRLHDFPGTVYEHFLASAVAVYPVLEEAALGGGGGVGSFILRAVSESVAWQKGGNTHFGAFTLLLPLVMAAGRVESLEGLRGEACRVVWAAGVEDAVDFYRAFSMGGVKVRPLEGEFDLRRGVDSVDLGLFSLMEVASGWDLVAREWVEGFPRSFRAADNIAQMAEERGIRDAVVGAFLEQLACEPDTFIETKAGRDAALWVMRGAGEVLESWREGCRERVEEFDCRLLARGLNPGSSADIISAGIFIALLGGLRF